MVTQNDIEIYLDDSGYPFEKVDEAIGEINSKLNENDSLIILSDHGMEKTKTNVNLNVYLEENGFLKSGRFPNKGYNNIENGTKAFVLEPSRVYLNKINKYPRGCVKKDEEQGLVNDLIDLFSRLKKNGIDCHTVGSEIVFPFFNNAKRIRF